MNALPFDNTFTGETQEQCACCKQWGWKDEVLKLSSPDGKETVRLCVDCESENVLHIEDLTLDAEQWKELKNVISNGRGMDHYLAEAKAELNTKAFAKLKRRIGL